MTEKKRVTNAAIQWRVGRYGQRANERGDESVFAFEVLLRSFLG